MKRFKSFRRSTFSHGVVDAKAKRVWNDATQIPRASCDKRTATWTRLNLSLKQLTDLWQFVNKRAWAKMYCSFISSIVLRKSTSALQYVFAVTQQNEIQTLSSCELGMGCVKQFYHMLKDHLFKGRFRILWNTGCVCKFANTLDGQLLKRPAQTKVHLLFATAIVWSRSNWNGGNIFSDTFLPELLNALV